MKKNVRRRFIVMPLTVLVAMTLLAAACGNPNKKSTSPATAPGESAKAFVGLNTCTTCHSDKTTDWLTSKHANLDADGNLDSTGSPALADLTAGCKGCHDPLGDSGRLVKAYTGNVARPVIGCESCHGAGSLHTDAGGTGAISLQSNTTGKTLGSVAVSGQYVMCTACHELLDSTGTGTNLNPAHLTTAPSGTPYFITDTHFAVGGNFSGTGQANIQTITGYAMDYSGTTVCTDCHHPHKKTIETMREWALSAHSDRTTNYASDLATQDLKGYFGGAWAHYNWSCDGSNSAGCGTSTVTGLPNSRTMCQRCHTTTGFAAYATALASGDTARITAMRNGTAVSGTSPYVTYSASFKPEMLKCNGCHTDSKGTVRNPGAVTADYNLTNTTSDNTMYIVAQASHTYPDVSSSNVCLTCHTGRASGDTIKNLSLSTSPAITTFTNVAFINSHYLTAGGTVFTATGYAFSGRSYTNPDSYMHNQIGTGDFKNTGTNGPCVGCHMSRPNGNGNHLFLPVGRFNPVQYADGTVSVTQGNTIVTGSSTTWLSAVDAATNRFLGPDGREYLISAVDSDTQITLTSAYQGASASGKVYAILKDGERIIGIASEACFNCHAGASTTLMEMLNQDRELFENALYALEHALDKRGFSFKPTNPYFFTKRSSDGMVSIETGSTIVTGINTLFTSASISTNTDKFRVYDGGLYDILSVPTDTQIILKSPYLGPTVNSVSYAVVTGTQQKNWDPGALGVTNARNNMGAAFNFNLLEHDPGAYVHNKTYILRLIYDALDWIDDYQLNYSVGTTLNALGNEPYKSKAIQYLLPNGIYPGVAAERP